MAAGIFERGVGLFVAFTKDRVAVGDFAGQNFAENAAAQHRAERLARRLRRRASGRLAARAGDLVPVGRGGERRAIALANPALGGKPYATPTLWAAIQYLMPGEDAPEHCADCTS